MLIDILFARPFWSTQGFANPFQNISRKCLNYTAALYEPCLQYSTVCCFNHQDVQ